MFAMAADHYDRHVGRYARLLAPRLIEWAQVAAGSSALDVGCGPGALTSALADLLGADKVAAIDPSPSFVEACRARNPGVRVEIGPAEALPFDDAKFHHTLAQLVVNFMSDAPIGVAQMRRVTRRDGHVSAATWDYGAGMILLRRFCDAAHALDSSATGSDELNMRYVTAVELADLWAGAGLREVRTTAIDVAADYASFDELWQPFEAGVGSAGAYAAALPDSARAALRAELHRRLSVGDGPFTLDARAWAVTGRA